MFSLLLLLLILTSCLPPSLPAFTTATSSWKAEHGEWNKKFKASWQSGYFHRLNNIMVSNQRLSSLLSPLLGHYEFTVPEVQLRRGSVYVGANHRLRAAVKRAMEGQPVKIGVIGGSISYGTGSSKRGVTDWSSLLGAWAAKAFTNVTVRNGCVPGTPSSYMVVCLDMSVEQDVDIVFSEYILNDGKNDGIADNPLVRGYERLVRRVLALPKRPALVLMQTFSHGTSFPPTHSAWTPFHDGIEDLYGALAQYYDLQWLSLRDTTYRLAMFINETGFQWIDITNGNNGYDDYIHMNDKGHKIMADLAVWLLQQTALDLVIRPWNEEDEELMSDPLPTPMYRGNTVPSSPMCMHFDAMKSLVVDAQGFEFVEEGEKKKKGYVGLKPGASISFSLNTSRGGEKDDKGEAPIVVVQLAHLRSYEHMGIAEASCVSGCTCPTKLIDGHHTQRESQTYLASLDVSQHPTCIVKVTVSNTTSSGEYKVKISGVMVSDLAGKPDNRPQYMQEVEWRALDNADGTFVHTRGRGEEETDR